MSKRFARHWQRTLLSYGMCEKSWQRFEAENFNLENGDRSGESSKIRLGREKNRQERSGVIGDERNLEPDLCNKILNLEKKGGKNLICTPNVNCRKGTRRHSSRLIRRRERRKSCVIR